MKAIIYHQYGSPDVLQLQEIEKPVVNDDGVLVRVRAASATPASAAPWASPTPTSGSASAM